MMVGCRVVDPQGGNPNIETTFDILPNFGKNEFNRVGDYLQIADSMKIYNEEFHITCIKSIFTYNTGSWCERFKLGENTQNYATRVARKIFTDPTDYQYMFLDPGLTLSAEMYHPINVDMAIISTNPQAQFRINIISAPDIPLHNYTNIFDEHTLNGCYQMFFRSKSSLGRLDNVTMLTMAVLSNKISIYLDPNRVKLGYEVTCVTSSADPLFIFGWSCKVKGLYRNISIYQPNETFNKNVRRILNNLFLTDVQTLRFEYLLPHNIYDCICQIHTFGMDQRNITISQHFEFDLKSLEYSRLFSKIKGSLYLYQIIAMILWMIILCSPAFFQHYMALSKKYKKYLTDKIIQQIPMTKKRKFLKQPYESYHLFTDISAFCIGFQKFRKELFNQKITTLLRTKRTAVVSMNLGVLKDSQFYSMDFDTSTLERSDSKSSAVRVFKAKKKTKKKREDIIDESESMVEKKIKNTIPLWMPAVTSIYHEFKLGQAVLKSGSSKSSSLVKYKNLKDRMKNKEGVVNPENKQKLNPAPWTVVPNKNLAKIQKLPPAPWTPVSKKNPENKQKLNPNKTIEKSMKLAPAPWTPVLVKVYEDNNIEEIFDSKDSEKKSRLRNLQISSRPKKSRQQRQDSSTKKNNE